MVIVSQRIDSTIHAIPPIPPVRLIRWMRNRAKHMGVDTAELLEHYQITGEKSRSRHFDVPESRLDIQSIEQYLELEQARKSDQLMSGIESTKDGEEQDFLPWDEDQDQEKQKLVRETDKIVSAVISRVFL